MTQHASRPPQYRQSLDVAMNGMRLDGSHEFDSDDAIPEGDEEDASIAGLLKAKI